MMAKIDFSKYHANGNHFMIVLAPPGAKKPSITRVRQWANRETGIGFDQLLWVSRDSQARNRLKVFNPDGSESQQCGNGVCCVASFLHAHDLCETNEVTLAIGKQKVFLRLLSNGRVAAKIESPEFLAKKTPYLGKVRNGKATFCVAKTEYEAGLVNLGNPHAVVIFPDITKAPLQKLGEALQASPDFPEGVNVGAMQILSSGQIRLRVFERGVGETSACGSGACAAVCIGRKWQLLDEKVQVALPGGITTIRYPDASGRVEMSVQPVKVFTGTLFDV